MRLSRAALTSMLAAGVAILPAAPLAAQTAPAAAPAPASEAPSALLTQPARNYSLSPAERTAIEPAIRALDSQDFAGAQALLPVAEANARGADAKYVVAQIQLRIGIQSANTQLQAQAIDGLIASGAATPEEMPALYEHQATFAAQAGDTAKAARALSQLAAVSANDPAALLRLGQLRYNANDRAGAVALFQRAVEVQEAAGQAVPEDWRRRLLGAAYTSRMMPQALTYARALVAAHPNPTNWRDALLIYRQFGSVTGAQELDLRRLMRAAQALNGEGDYIPYADALIRAGLVGEAKAVLEEGFARRTLPAGNRPGSTLLASASGRIAEDRASLPTARTRALAAADGRQARATADAYFGYGQYAEAAELYRAALQKGGEDPHLVNTRLGASLALAGRRAEAETAFRAVSGSYAELARFWLTWLARPGA